MVSSRLRTTIVFFALCGLIAGSAFAGSLASNPTNFAHEIAATLAGGVTSPTNLTFTPQVYTMGIARNMGQNFILRYKLGNGALFGTTLGVPVYSGVPANVSVVLRSGGVGTDTVEYDVNVLLAVGTAIGDTFTLSGTVTFPLNAPVGAATTLQVDVRDVISGLDTVPGPYTRVLATLLGAGSVTATANNLATIDATATVPLTAFVAQTTGPVAEQDTTLIAKVGITTSNQTATVYNAAGTPGATIYSLVPGDKVNFTLTGDFSGISQVGIDFGNGGAITPTALTSTNEAFTIAANLQTATLTVDGDRLGISLASTIWFTKTAAAALNPRMFGISATVVPVTPAQTRPLANTNNYFEWRQNSTTMIAPYTSFTPGNGVKFRFTNSSVNDIMILVTVTMDQAGTANQLINNFTVPATGSRQITFSDAPSAGTNELGPIASLNTAATYVLPVRGKVTFNALTATGNVTGCVLVYSPVGVVTIQNMFQNPAW